MKSLKKQNWLGTSLSLGRPFPRNIHVNAFLVYTVFEFLDLANNGLHRFRVSSF